MIMGRLQARAFSMLRQKRFLYPKHHRPSSPIPRSVDWM